MASLNQQICLNHLHRNLLRNRQLYCLLTPEYLYGPWHGRADSKQAAERSTGT